ERGAGRQVEGRRKDGTVFLLEVSVGELRLDGRRYFTGVAHDLTDRRRRDEERDRRLAEERFLAEAGVALASSLDYEQTLVELAHLAVPEVADWCSVDLLSEEGDVVNVAFAHAAPDRAALAEAVHVRLERGAHGGASGAAGVLRTGKPAL